MKRLTTAAIACLAGLAMSVSVVAQERGGGRGAARGLPGQVDGSLSNSIVANAPFSADAITTVTQTLADGTKIEQRTTTKWYRDSLGRVRREQTVIGLDRLNPSAEPQTTITFDSVPGDQSPYTLNPTARTARRTPLGVLWLSGAYWSGGDALYRANRTAAVNLLSLVGGLEKGQPGSLFRPYERAIRAGLQTAPIPPDLKPTEEQLGSRQVEGVKATGRRSTTVIPAGRIGNDRAIQVVEEQWDSPELNMVVSSRFSDPRTGVVEYRLTNINRSEPRSDLFTVPAGYTVIDTGIGLGGGGRGAAPQGGQRGGRGN